VARAFGASSVGFGRGTVVFTVFPQLVAERLAALIHAIPVVAERFGLVTAAAAILSLIVHFYCHLRLSNF
jgi:hypothetical protein